MDDDLILWKFGYSITLIAKHNKLANKITVYDDVLDGRFRDRLKLDYQTGSLTITNTTMKHAGYYKILTNSARKSFDLTVSVVKEISVKKGDFVTLHNDLTEMKDDDRIQWSFEYGPVIAEINKWANKITVYDDVLDGRFRDRLELDKQTGSLTITHTTTTDSGVYELDINYMKMIFTLTVYGVFGVNWPVSVKEGDSVTLNSDTEMMDDDLILWKFGYSITLIAKHNKLADKITVYDDVLDGRFRDRLKLDYQTGSLTITNTTMKHAGYYKILTNSARKSFDLTVSVVKEISVKKGDFVTLHNDLTEMKDDDRIQWSFEYGPVIAEINKWANKITVYDDVLDGRFRDRLKLDKQTGSLTITHTTTTDSGVYELDINYMKMIFTLTVYDVPAAERDEVKTVSVKQEEPVTLDPGKEPVPLDPEEEPVPLDPGKEPVPLDPEEEPVTLDPGKEPVPLDPEEEPVPLDPGKEPVPLDPGKEPVPLDPGKEPVPLDPEKEPVPLDPGKEPVPLDPEKEPVPLDPGKEPVPLDPGKEPVPLDPEKEPVPLDPGKEPVPLDPGKEPVTLDPGKEPVPLDPGKEPVPLDPGKEPVTLDPGKEPVPLDPGKEPVPLDPGKEPVPLDPGKEPVPLDPGKEPVTLDPGKEPVPLDPGKEPVPLDPGKEPVPLDPGKEPVTLDPGKEPVTLDPGVITPSLIITPSLTITPYLTITNTRNTDSGDDKIHLTISTNNIGWPRNFNVSVKSGVSVSVMGGDSVTLNSGIEMKQHKYVKWYLNETLIAQMTGDQKTDVQRRKRFSDRIDHQTGSLTITHTDSEPFLSAVSITGDQIKTCTDVQCDDSNERFRDRLKLDPQTGSLTITNTTNTDAGEYQLQIDNSISKNFDVSVTGRHSGGLVEVFVSEGDSVIFHTVCEVTQQNRIRWYFKGKSIAQFTGDKGQMCTDVQCEDGDERFTDRLKLDPQTGSLTIMNITNTDSGEYEVEIININSSNIRNISVSVHGFCQYPPSHSSNPEFLLLNKMK
ncbi:hypothetical protein R3I93_016919 [Phoxinus phoxinus]|uniref:Immunoglobulin domain-containing protein n=1 Tax=Phoxinus phoxinus TaxID=58324 RepID=A0AAN9CH87_9TELE